MSQSRPSARIAYVPNFSNRRNFGALAAKLALPVVAAVAQTQLPFSPGERITYRVQVNSFRNIGQATMSVQGPVDVRGIPTYLLRSQTTAGIGPLKGSELTESWLDPVAMRSLRFHERERRLFSTQHLRIEIYPDEQRWTSADGESGRTLSAAPLDELSFIYYLRSLTLEPDSAYQFDRHFDVARNPVTVRVMRGNTVTTAVGVFPTLIMEMHVRDPRRYRGDGVIRVYLSADKCRIPVRVESTVPGTGSVVLTIESYTGAAPACGYHNL